MNLAARPRGLVALALCGFMLALITAPAVAGSTLPNSIKVYRIKPSAVDPAVKHDDWPSWVMYSPAAPSDVPLVVFFPGTHGKPGSHGDRPLMALVVEQGYRLLWLSYDNDISVSKKCPHSLDPGCSAAFRRMRVYGTGKDSPVTNNVHESIVSRLEHVLTSLAKAHPNEHWGQYLNHGKPAWKHMVVAGHSSGAGMAAFIAKQHEVDRVVLFSSPWDDWHPAGQKRQTAAWLSWPSVTPLNRWYAEFHEHEDTASLLAAAYKALRIPSGHVFVFALDLPPGYTRHHHHNPYHTATTRDVRYAPTWRVMFGHPSAVEASVGTHQGDRS